MKVKEIKINLWDFVDVEKVNKEVDKINEFDEIPTDINFKCLDIDEDGNIKIQATFNLD